VSWRKHKLTALIKQKHENNVRDAQNNVRGVRPAESFPLLISLLQWLNEVTATGKNETKLTMSQQWILWKIESHNPFFEIFDLAAAVALAEAGVFRQNRRCCHLRKHCGGTVWKNIAVTDCQIVANFAMTMWRRELVGLITCLKSSHMKIYRMQTKHQP